MIKKILLLFTVTLLIGCDISSDGILTDGGDDNSSDTPGDNIPDDQEPDETDPDSSDPTPDDPQPSDPTPADPQPSDPTPTDPQPSDPTPADPQPSDPTPALPVKTEMTSNEVEQFLYNKTFDITTFRKDGLDWLNYGSGWLFDESLNNWYIATSQATVSEFYYDTTNAYKLCVSNKWDDMRTYYDYKTVSGDLKNSNPGIKSDGALLDVGFNNCMEAEITYISPDPGSASVDRVSFAVLKISKHAASTYIPADEEPLKLKTQQDIDDDLVSLSQVYNLSSGRGRWGSFFDQTKLLFTNNYEAKYWSPTFADPNGHYGAHNISVETGYGSSGSAFVDKYGEVISIMTFNYGYAFPISEAQAAGNPYGYYGISGTSSVYILNSIIPVYASLLTESTTLVP